MVVPSAFVVFTRVRGSCNGVGTAEKSPARIAAVMVVPNAFTVRRDLNPSKFAMKKSRFLPLNNFGT